MFIRIPASVSVVALALLSLTAACDPSPPKKGDGDGEGGSSSSPSSSASSSSSGGGGGGGSAGWPVSGAPIPARPLHSVFTISPELALAGGEDGTLLGYMDGKWQTLTFPANHTIESIWAASPDDVYFVTSGGVYRWDGASYTQPLPGGFWRSVWGTSADDVWVVGSKDDYLDGIVYHNTGGTWTIDYTVPNTGSYGRIFNAVWASSPDDVWVAGQAEDGVLYHKSKGIWEPHTPSGPVTYNGLHGTNADNVWLVGYKYFVSRWDNAQWSNPDSMVANQYVEAVFTTGPTEAWVAQGDGITHYNGGQETLGDAPNVNALHGSNGSAIWAVGGAGGLVIYRWDGSSSTWALDVHAP